MKIIIPLARRDLTTIAPGDKPGVQIIIPPTPTGWNIQ